MHLDRVEGPACAEEWRIRPSRLGRVLVPEVDPDCAFGAHRARMPAGDHFDGEDLVRDRAERDRQRAFHPDISTENSRLPFCPIVWWHRSTGGPTPSPP